MSNFSSANDMSTNTDPPGAAARMGSLVDKILAAVPESMVIVSGLMPMSNEAAEKLSVGSASISNLSNCASPPSLIYLC